MSQPASWRRQWPHRYRRCISDLTHEELEAIEVAAGECRIMPGLLLEAMLRGSVDVLTRPQVERLDRWCAQVRVDAEARKIYQVISDAPDLDAAPEEKLIWLVRSGQVPLPTMLRKLRDDDTPAPGAELSETGGDPLAKSINDMTVEEIAAALDDRLEAERPGQYQFEISLPEEGHLHISRTVKRLSRR